MPATTRDPKAVEADLVERLADCRSLLRDRPSKARGLLKQLIVGRLKMLPDSEEGVYRFVGTGTILPLIAGLIPMLPQCGSSPTGLNG